MTRILKKASLENEPLAVDFSRFGPSDTVGPASMEERWRQIFDLVQLGADMEQASPNRDGILQERELHEAAWRTAIQRLVTQHVTVVRDTRGGLS